MGLGVGRHNLKTFGTTVYGLTHPKLWFNCKNVATNENNNALYNMIHAISGTDIWVGAKPNPPTNLKASESNI